MKTCLITGSEGFLGGYVGRRFAKAGYRVVGVDRRLQTGSASWSAFYQTECVAADLDAIIETWSPTVVLHLAGSSSVMDSVREPLGDFTSLLPGTAALVRAVGRAASRPRVILFSSAAVYGEPDVLPVKESAPTRPMSPYGVHKLLAESLVNEYARLFRFEAVVMRIFSAYGPGLQRQVVWDICQKALKAASTGTPALLLSGSGDESRDFIHADDVANAALLLAESESVVDPVVNVASGVETPIRELAKALVELLDLPVDVHFDGLQRAGDPARWRADITSLRSYGFCPSVRLPAGLREVANVASTRADRGVR